MNFKIFNIVGCIREWLLAKEIARVEKEMRDIEDKLDMFFHEFRMSIFVDTNANMVKMKRLRKIYNQLSVYLSILKTSPSVEYARERLEGYSIPTHQDTLFLIHNTYIGLGKVSKKQKPPFRRFYAVKIGAGNNSDRNIFSSLLFEKIQHFPFPAQIEPPFPCTDLESINAGFPSEKVKLIASKTPFWLMV